MPPTSTQPAAMPLVAMILGLMGLCLFPLLPVAVVLAIISLARSSQPAYSQRMVMAIVALVTPVAFVPIAGILTAIAIPNFVRFQARAKQTECKVNLQAALAAEEAFRAQHGAYTTSPAQLGFAPPAMRSVLRFSSAGSLSSVGLAPTRPGGPEADVLDRGILPDLRATLGVTGACPQCSITIACALEVDHDPTVDVWSISSAERDGILAGQPHNEVNDVVE